MNKKNLIIIFFLFGLVACGSNNAGAIEKDTNYFIDGIAFDYVNTFYLEDEKYDLYMPNNISESLFYLYSESGIKSNCETLTINYSFNNQYIFRNDLTSLQKERIYEILNYSKETIDNATNFISTIYKFDERVTEETTLTNESKEEISFIILTTYLPLKFKKDNMMYVVSVPLKNQYLPLKNGLIYNPFTLELTNYDSFKNLHNVKERRI